MNNHMDLMENTIDEDSIEYNTGANLFFLKHYGRNQDQHSVVEFNKQQDGNVGTNEAMGPSQFGSAETKLKQLHIKLKEAE